MYNHTFSMHWARHFCLGLCLYAISSLLPAKEVLRVLTWDGYVAPEELVVVNQLLRQQGYDIDVRVIEPLAQGPEQMFDLLRRNKVDVSFLTLNYIKMQGEKTAQLLQPINTQSSRLSNYRFLNPDLTHIAMGLNGDGLPLYIPFGGGAYGIWANMSKLTAEELPTSVNDLWQPRWKGKLSLTRGQIQPNVALACLALGMPPFYLNGMVFDRGALLAASKSNSPLQNKLNALYAQVGYFWDDIPVHSDAFLLVASYGPGISQERARDREWKLVPFKEGNTVWLDTINFYMKLSGKKLEAAEIFANYFIGKQVQNRVVNQLDMVATSTLVDKNPLLDDDPHFFNEQMFWPPYDRLADNTMHIMSDYAMQMSGHQVPAQPGK